MRGRLDELKSAGAQLVAIDPHEPWAAKSLLKEVGIPADLVSYPLLCDAGYTVGSTYGVSFQMRIHTEISSRPATFIIDRDGMLRYARRGKTFGDRPSIDDILAELKKL